ncbi:hypothetical protein BDF20DRAFT_910041 [Mycotypha africana]|uniref:uncharacterized protein n=1 Tax=Mycotypha africana TaxID=64632 RepID=UPI002300DD3B|nr:uncharacterized protein BDF20DRAFT_910041 [Mycotypha africana]KAI8987416.1 hypothetical protein BDF20DRAFT_910041 [Mycotypha africana]
MFDAPSSTILCSLNNLLDHPKEYLADVCFKFDKDEVWAHRAIILARAPKDFVTQYLSDLLKENAEVELPIQMDISHIIPQDIFQSVLRFWYTASLEKFASRQSSLSDLTSTYTPLDTSPFLSPVNEDTASPLEDASSSALYTSMAAKIQQLSEALGVELLPASDPSLSATTQLINDMEDLRHDKIAADVTISLISFDAEDADPTASKKDSIPCLFSTSPENHTYKIDLAAIASFKAHRCVLAAQSPYFHALFCAQFQEASSTVVHFTNDLFNEDILDCLLHFLYTDRITVTPLAQLNAKPTTQFHQKAQRNKHTLRVLQKAFYAADYLGQRESFGKALLHAMETLCHQFKCVCADCAILLPSMLAWSDKQVDTVPKLRRTLILLYSDPVHSLHSLWSQRPFAMLVTSLVPSPAGLGEDTLAAVVKHEPLFRARSPLTLVHEIIERCFLNVTKHNAIHALHSMHLCLSQLRSADPHPSWSRATLALIHPLLHYTVSMVSQFFDFYCVEYPILLSCVDGIGGGFSVDFLDFLLRHVLNEGIQEINAGVIYQGIRRDLIGRQEVVQNMAIDDVLVKGRQHCAAYLAQHWTKVKAVGGLRPLEKATLRQLAEDINVPYRSLTGPFDSEFANIFSFKPRKHKKNFSSSNSSSSSSSSSNSYNNNDSSSSSSSNRRRYSTTVSSWQENKNASFTEAYSRRLSLGSLVTRSSESSQHRAAKTRPRALSSESVLCTSLRKYHTTPEQMIPDDRENQPLINLLAYETMERGRQLEEQDRLESEERGMHSLSHEELTTFKNTLANTPDIIDRPMLRRSSSFTSLTDRLLPLDISSSHPVSRPQQWTSSSSSTTSCSSSPTPSAAATPTLSSSPEARPTRLKFELPVPPIRSKSPKTTTPMATGGSAYLTPRVSTKQNRKRKGSKSRKSRWNIGSSSDASDEEDVSPEVGDKVELLHRPLPTLGTIKYIGPVQFAEGPYVGVELESRLGKSDGSVDGVRYFQTDPQRGLFVRPDDFIILSSTRA